MKLGVIIVFAITLTCALIFEFFSLLCFISKKPVTFLSWERISESTISDVKKYNHTNGILWLIYGFLWLIAAFIGLYSLGISGIVLGIWFVVYSIIRSKMQISK